MILDEAAEVYSRWPETRSAAPPRPVPDPTWGLIDAAAEWRKIHDRVASGRFRLTRPASTWRGLVGPIESDGYCLGPLSLPGDLFWFDTTISPVSGDLVLLHVSDEKCRETLAHPETPAHATVGRLRNVWSKIWLQPAHPYLLYTMGGREDGRMLPFFRADGSRPYRVLGVARYITRGGGQAAAGGVRRGTPIYGSGKVAISK